MAADERKIVIELKSLVGSSDGEDTDDSEDKEDQRASAAKSAVKQINTFVARELVAEVSFEINRYLSLSEDYKNAVRLANIKTTVNKVKALGQSAVNAFVLGSQLGGPVGGVIGAFIGVGMAGISEAAELKRQYNEQDLQLALNDRATGYARSRLGLIDNGRGTYN